MAGQPVAVERRDLTPHERLEEALFTGLRLTEGVDVDAPAAVTAWTSGPGTATSFSRSSTPACCVREGPRLRLTREGMLVANEVMAVFV